MKESSQPLTSILGKYRHYKGNEYEVLGVGKHTETEEKMVIYKALYPPFETWLRPYEMFFGTIELDGKNIARFEKISD
jgi:hypothetical protein